MPRGRGVFCSQAYPDTSRKSALGGGANKIARRAGANNCSGVAHLAGRRKWPPDDVADVDVAVPRGRGVFLLAGVPWYESRKPRGAIICMGAISFLRHDVDGDGDADDVDVDTLLLSNVGIPDFTKCSPRLDR